MILLINTTTLTLRNNYTSLLTRNINKIIILIPLGKPCNINLNGKSLTISEGLIINNTDLYQYEKVEQLIELAIPLQLLCEKASNLNYIYYDFKQIVNFTSFKRLITHDLFEAYCHNKNIHAYIKEVIQYLLDYAKVQLNNTYLPAYYTKHPLLRKIVDYINSHIDTALTTKDLADAFYISQSYISILFSKHMSINYKSYINSLRISLSIYDLINNQYSISNIAVKYNFNNVAIFTKHFKFYLKIPPKEYKYQYRATSDTYNYKLKVLDKELVVFLKSYNQTQALTKPNDDVLKIDLTKLKPNIHINGHYVIIHLNSLYDLLVVADQQLENRILQHFSNINFLIKNTNVEHLNVLDSQKLFNAIVTLIQKQYHLTFNIHSLDSFQLFEHKILKLIKAHDKEQSLIRQLCLLFEPSQLITTENYNLIHSVLQPYQGLKTALVIDHFIEKRQNLTDIISHIHSIQVDYYYINMDLIQLSTYISLKSKHNNHHAFEIKQQLKHLIELCGRTMTQKLVFNNITHPALIKYFKHTICASHIYFTQFLIDFDYPIAGLGYPLYSIDENQLMVIDHNQSLMPMVHVYNMLQPFMNQNVTLINNGIIFQQDKRFHILLYHHRATETQSNHLKIEIAHHINRDFPIFSRLLNNQHGNIKCLISSSLYRTSINTTMLNHINHSNYPFATYNKHNHHKAINLSLDDASIHYLMINYE